MTSREPGSQWSATTPDPWIRYLASYHSRHPGITETVLTSASHPSAGNPYSWLRDSLPAQPGRVLDLACGSAPMHPLVADATSYLGVDLSAAELACAAERGRGPLLNCDAGQLPLPDESVDTVVCSMAVMLLRPIGPALAEVRRVLRPGGVFATIRPVGSPFHLGDLRLAVPLLLGLRHLPEMPQRFTRSGLRTFLEAAGLSVTSDLALRFVHPLETESQARLALEALYLPHVSEGRRRDAERRLARLAGAGKELPVAIRRTVAVRL